MTNVLYISYDGMTDPLGQSQVLPYICALSKEGFRFTLISCEKPHLFHQNEAIIRRICDENKIDWYPLPYTKSPPILSTIKDIWAIRKKAYELHQTKQFSIIHCRSYISAMVGLWMKKKYNTRFLFDMRGLWADEKVDAGAWRLNHPIYKTVYDFFKKKEKQYFEEADYTISLTAAGKKEIQSWAKLNNNPVPIEVIPCCVETALFDPAAIDPNRADTLKKELKIKESDCIISYVGSIGTWYMLDEMLDFFCVFQRKQPSARFLFITGDEHQKILQTAVKKGVTEDSIIIRKSARKDVPIYISLSDYSIFFIRPTYSKIASSPTKQAELMAMGIPLICNSGVGDTDAIVNRYHAGVTVDGFDVDSYEKAIEKLSNQTFSPEKLRQGAIEFYSLEKGVAAYKKVYDRMLSE